MCLSKSDNCVLDCVSISCRPLPVLSLFSAVLHQARREENTNFIYSKYFCNNHLFCWVRCCSASNKSRNLKISPIFCAIWYACLFEICLLFLALSHLPSILRINCHGPQSFTERSRTMTEPSYVSLQGHHHHRSLSSAIPK